MTDDVLPPRLVGGVHEVTLTGCALPWDDGPVTVYLTGSSYTYLPIFSSPEEALRVLSQFGISFSDVKRIENGPEFLESIPDDLVVILNLRLTAEGTTRFTQVVR